MRNFKMDEKIIYAFRGWIAFVAFMDMGTSVRCFIENRSFLGQHNLDDTTLPRVLGMYSVLKALTLVHCTLYIHIKPVVSLGISSLLVTILMYISEVLYFHTTQLSFYVIFPCILNAFTLLGLVFLHFRLHGTKTTCMEDENAELLRQAGAAKRRRPRKMT